MGLFSSKKDSGDGKKSAILNILDDLTYMEINTIIKPTMGASTPPAFDELVKKLKDNYSIRLKRLLTKNKVAYPYKKEDCKSYQYLHISLKKTEQFMDKNNIRMNSEDYVIFSRMMGFCEYLKYSDIKVKSKDGKEEKFIYKMQLFEFKKYDFEPVSPRDKARIRRMYDLGSEKIILQTRFGIDGDVVTRISQHYAAAPKEALTKIHDKHVQLSVSYWQSLIKTATDLIGSIIGGK